MVQVQSLATEIVQCVWYGKKKDKGKKVNIPSIKNDIPLDNRTMVTVFFASSFFLVFLKNSVITLISVS